MDKENCWQHSLHPEVQYQFIVDRSIQNPLRQEKLLNSFLQHYRITTNNVDTQEPCLFRRLMVQAFFTIARFHQSCFYGRPRDKKVQGFSGLKIANVELITLFNYVNPSRVNQNNAVRQVLIE
ncbi:MAG: hypothetical protein ABIK15_14145 [Pseudomonadota bacterium]